MFFLLALAIIFIVYVATFNKDFKEDDLGKAVPFLVAIGAVALILFILGNVLR